MKNIDKYTTTRSLVRITHVAIPSGKEQLENEPPRIEAISADPNSTGKMMVFYCTPEIYKQVLGERDGNVSKLKLRGFTQYAILARFGKISKGNKDFSGVVGIDQIPLRYFDGKSGPVTQKKNRINGFEMEWVEEQSGFRVKEAYLGLGRRGFERLLEDIRKNLGNKRSYTTGCKHQVSFVNETTLLVKNPKPFREETI